uniref:Uncharacterized protein n=1 Tax=Romanomermis culicivorax TaxID=13658 RepID=A0A915KPG8_ROMCU
MKYRLVGKCIQEKFLLNKESGGSVLSPQSEVTNFFAVLESKSGSFLKTSIPIELTKRMTTFDPQKPSMKIYQDFESPFLGQPGYPTSRDFRFLDLSIQHQWQTEQQQISFNNLVK